MWLRSCDSQARWEAKVPVYTADWLVGYRFKTKILKADPTWVPHYGSQRRSERVNFNQIRGLGHDPESGDQFSQTQRSDHDRRRWRIGRGIARPHPRGFILT